MAFRQDCRRRAIVHKSIRSFYSHRLFSRQAIVAITIVRCNFINQIMIANWAGNNFINFPFNRNAAISDPLIVFIDIHFNGDAIKLR